MKKTKKLQRKLLLYILLFVVGLLLFVWLFEITFLQSFYENTKINEIKDLTPQIIEILDDERMEIYLNSLARQNDACILVIDQNADTFASNRAGCQLNNLSYNDIYYLLVKASENGGSYTALDNDKLLIYEPFVGNLFMIDNDNVKSITYAQIIDSDTFVLIESAITPMVTTIKTIQTQIVFISIFVIIATLLLVSILSAKIVKPIEKIDQAAKDLANGRYQNDMNASYREANDLNQTLAKAAAEIQKADQAKRDLISNVSHDLRTPLTMISGYGELMIDFPEEKTDENIKIIIDETKRLTNLVNDLLDLSKLEDKKIKIVKQSFDLSSMIRQVYDSYQLLDKQIDLTLECDDNVLVLGDEQRLQQVVHNFINNAINYSLGKPIAINCKKSENFAIVSVVDHGVGISKQDLPYIWDRYYKVDKTHIRSSVGSGIGLAIAKEILELHDADYGVRSTEGQGSTFYFKLPIC